MLLLSVIVEAGRRMGVRVGDGDGYGYGGGGEPSAGLGVGRDGGLRGRSGGDQALDGEAILASSRSGK